MKSNAIAKANVVALPQPSVIVAAENVAVQKPTAKAVSKSAKGTAEFKAIFDRPYGSEGHTFGEAMEHSADVYKGLVKKRKNALKDLRSIGIVLIEFRTLIGKSDKEFGQAIAKTSLSVMSRQDRSDAMWLAENWDSVQSFMKDMDISSSSAAYLRQKISKAKKSDSTKSASTEGTEESADEVTESEATVEASTQQSDEVTETTSLDVDSEESFAASIKLIAEKQGLNLAKVVACLIKS